MNSEKIQEYIMFYLSNYLIALIIVGGWTILVNEFQLTFVLTVSAFMTFFTTLLILKQKERENNIRESVAENIEAVNNKQVEEGEKKNVKIKIEDALDLIKDPHLKGCSFLYLDKLKQMGFDHAPASTRIHHAYDGGLRDHVEEMLELGFHFIEKVPNINLDYLIVAIVFHDAGKTQLYIKVNDHYEHNPFIENKDHSFVPVDDWVQLGYNMPEEVRLAILSHMGGWSVTGVYPDRLLDTVLCAVDLISSRLKGDW